MGRFRLDFLGRLVKKVFWLKRIIFVIRLRVSNIAKLTEIKSRLIKFVLWLHTRLIFNTLSLAMSFTYVHKIIKVKTLRFNLLLFLL